MKTIPVVLMASLLALSACNSKGESEKSPDKLTANPPKGKTVDGNAKSSDQAKPTGHTPTVLSFDEAGREALWALAPENAGFGIVAAPGSLQNIHSSVLELVRVFEARPFGLDLMAKLRAKSSAPFDLFDPAAFTANGFDLKQGFAIFMVGDNNFGVFPISDRAAFRKLVDGTEKSMEGMDVDLIDDDMFCTQKEKFYVCTSSIADLKTFGTPVNGSLAKYLTALTTDQRGAVEAAGDVVQIKSNGWKDEEGKFDKVFDSTSTWIVALQQEQGALTIRGSLKSKFKDKLAEAVAVPSVLRVAAVSSNPEGIIALRLPTSLWMDEAKDKVIPGGINLKTDILGNLTGELIAYAPTSSTLWGRIEFGLKDAAPFRKILNMGCGMAATIPGLSSTPGDGTCSLLVDLAKIPKMEPRIATLFPGPVQVTATVKDDRFQITIGNESAIDTSRKLSSIGQELTSNDWNGVFWTKGIALGHALTQMPWDMASTQMPAEAMNGIKLGMWVMSHVHELGMAGGVRDDGLHGILRIGTYAADPAETYTAYESAVTKIIDGNQSTEELTALKKRWPNSLVGQQDKIGTGTVMLTSITGIIAAVAIPAFVKYMKLSREAAEKPEEMIPPPPPQVPTPAN